MIHLNSKKQTIGALIKRMSKLSLFSFLILISCSNTSKMKNTETVKNLDINRYLGTWYEIARYPHSFEKNLQGVTATYSLQDGGKIKVVNKGYQNSLEGKLKTAIGKAKIPDVSKPGNLKVSFFWLFYADYFVMELDQENYQWAVVGSTSPKYLWILSRTPQMEAALYQELLGKIEKRGYSLKQLQLVEQK